MGRARPHRRGDLLLCLATQSRDRTRRLPLIHPPLGSRPDMDSARHQFRFAWILSLVERRGEPYRSHRRIDVRIIYCDDIRGEISDSLKPREASLRLRAHFPAVQRNILLQLIKPLVQNRHILSGHL